MDSKINESETVSKESSSETVIKKKKKTPIIIASVVLVIVVLAAIVIVTATATSASRKSARQVDLGNKYLSELDYEQAVLSFKEAIKIDPKNEEAYEALIDTLIRWADQKAGDGDPDGAIILIENEANSLEEMKNSDNSEMVDKYLQRLLEKLKELREKADLETQGANDRSSLDDKGALEEDNNVPESEEIDPSSIAWTDWFDHSNPVLNQYMEGLGYRYELLQEPTDRTPDVMVRWVKEDLSEYEYYGVELEYCPTLIEEGFLQTFHFLKGLYGSPIGNEFSDYNMSILLKAVKKHAELYPTVSQRVKELADQGIEIEYIPTEDGGAWGGHFSDEVFDGCLNEFGSYLKELGDFKTAY